MLPILGALGILPLPMTAGTPVWVGVAAGAVFVLGGLAIIDANTRLRSRGTTGDPVQVLLACTICVAFAAIAGWIAFGSGVRRFSSSVRLPFMSRSGSGGEWLGRAAFGVGAVMAGAIAAAILVQGFRKKRQPA